MTQVLIIRPEPDATRMAKRVKDLGLTPIIAPVMRIEPVEATIKAQDYDAIIVTSPHAWSKDVLAQVPHSLPVYCVGMRAQTIAQAAGFPVSFSVADSAELCDLLEQTMRGKRLLYLSGEQVHGDLAAVLAPSITVDRIVTYSAVPVADFPDEALAALKQGCHVLLASDRSVELFVTMVAKYQLDEALPRITSICLSESIAATAERYGIKKHYVAAAPNEDALIAALVSSC